MTPTSELTPETLETLHEPSCDISVAPQDAWDHSSPGCTCEHGAMRLGCAVAWRADRAALAEWETSFALYHDAMRRGTDAWRAKTGNTEVMPDTAKLVEFLLDERDVDRAALAAIMDLSDRAEALGLVSFDYGDFGFRPIEQLDAIGDVLAALHAKVTVKPTDIVEWYQEQVEKPPGAEK